MSTKKKLVVSLAAMSFIGLVACVPDERTPKEGCVYPDLGYDVGDTVVHRSNPSLPLLVHSFRYKTSCNRYVHVVVPQPDGRTIIHSYNAYIVEKLTP